MTHVAYAPYGRLNTEMQILGAVSTRTEKRTAKGPPLAGTSVGYTC